MVGVSLCELQKVSDVVSEDDATVGRGTESLHFFISGEGHPQVQRSRHIVALLQKGLIEPFLLAFSSRCRRGSGLIRFELRLRRDRRIDFGPMGHKKGQRFADAAFGQGVLLGDLGA